MHESSYGKVNRRCGLVDLVNSTKLSFKLLIGSNLMKIRS
jgi:hypothetical protein